MTDGGGRREVSKKTEIVIWGANGQILIPPPPSMNSWIQQNYNVPY